MAADATPRPSSSPAPAFAAAALLGALLAAGCGDAAPDRNAEGSAADAPAGAAATGADAPPDPSSLRPPATYRGLMPCADCPGIQATLEAETDGSARLVYLYMEGEIDSDPVFVDEGRWEVDDDDRLLFHPEGGGRTMMYAFVDGNLVALDGSGELLPSSLPRTLIRAPAGPMGELAQTSWRFVDPAPAGGNAAVPSLRFAADGVLTGSDGCNSMRATWTVEAEAGLRVGPVASTRMACPEGAGGVALRVAEAITAARDYRLEREGSVLVLLDAAGSEVARLRPTP